MQGSIAAAIALHRRDNRFFLACAIALPAILIIGFTPSLYPRAVFETPPGLPYLHPHGAILSGLFVWRVARASLE
jgi:hypothetical protein